MRITVSRRAPEVACGLSQPCKALGRLARHDSGKPAGAVIIETRQRSAWRLRGLGHLGRVRTMNRLLLSGLGAPQEQSFMSLAGSAQNKTRAGPWELYTCA